MYSDFVLPDDKNFSLVEFERNNFADDNFDRVDNIVGNGENAAYQHDVFFFQNIFKRVKDKGFFFVRKNIRTMLPQLRTIYHAYYILGKSRTNHPPIKLNFSISNAFLQQPAVYIERASFKNLNNHFIAQIFLVYAKNASKRYALLACGPAIIQWTAVICLHL